MMLFVVFLINKTQQKYLCYNQAQTKWDYRWLTLQEVKGAVTCSYERCKTILLKPLPTAH